MNEKSVNYSYVKNALFERLLFCKDNQKKE